MRSTLVNRESPVKKQHPKPGNIAAPPSDACTPTPASHPPPSPPVGPETANWAWLLRINNSQTVAAAASASACRAHRHHRLDEFVADVIGTVAGDGAVIIAYARTRTGFCVQQIIRVYHTTVHWEGRPLVQIAGLLTHGSIW